MSTESEYSLPSPRPRRASITDLLVSRPSTDLPTTNSNSSKFPATPLASAMAQKAQQQSRTRRLSVTTLGLSGSPPQSQQTSPFGSLKKGHGTHDSPKPAIGEGESAIDDEEALGPMSAGGNGQGNASGSPFARRMSFGARAYGESRSSSGGSASGVGMTSGNGTTFGTTHPASSSTTKTREGFNWSENLRTRAKRLSISSAPGPFLPLAERQNRSQNAGSTEPTSVPQVSKVHTPPKAPDHFQERILKGDFYMD